VVKSGEVDLPPLDPSDAPVAAGGA